MITVSKLPSGLTVAGERMPHLHSVSLGLWVRAGSLHEAPQENGISHFIEHMVFKGSDRRSARDIAEAMDGVGGNLNAFTAKDSTCFYAAVVDEHLPLAVDVLFDMVLHPRLDPAELEREKLVVLEEIAMVEDNPEELSGELIAGAYFGKHPLGQPILGPAENVRSFTAGQLEDYMARYYRPENMVLSIVGNFDPQGLEALVEAQLAGLEPRGDFAPPEDSAAPACAGRILRPRAVEQVHLNLALPAFSRTDSGYRSMTVLNSILGGGMSSRLFQRIREERGLAYSVYSYPFCYALSGSLNLYAGLNGENLGQTMDVILEELESLRRGDFTDGELIRSREQLKGSFILGLDSPGSRMMSMGKSLLLYGRLRSEEEVLEEIAAVSRDSVARAAARLLDMEKLAVALVGPEDVDYGAVFAARGIRI